MPRFRKILLATLLAGLPAFAQHSHEGPEDFRLELTGALWLNGPTGYITADGTPVDFVHDLAAGAQKPRFFGRLIIKPGRKHRIVVEGSPLSFSGVNTVDRSFIYLNRTFSVSQTVVSNASVGYAFAGYQYDPWSGRSGHLGFQVGAAYLGVSGTLHGIQSGITETKSLQGVVPLAGTEFRFFPIPNHRLVEVEGVLRGIPAGAYGYYVEGGANAGIRFRSIALLAGYRELFANLHETNAAANGVVLRLKGPIFSLQWQW